jgi:hypothetical protein
VQRLYGKKVRVEIPSPLGELIINPEDNPDLSGLRGAAGR